MGKAGIDSITLSTVWHSLQSICREMRYDIERTCQSYLISQLHDISVGIWDAKARTVAVPIGLPSQFLGGKFSVRYIMDKFKESIYPGDVFLNNDPYKGYCNHLPDWGFFRPIFCKDRLLFFTLARGHQTDTGGAYPGGYFPNAYDIHAEGLCIPPIKIVERGKEREDILELIWNNVRWPEAVRVDNYSLMASTQTCENRIVDLVEKYGVDTVLACVEEMMSRMEKTVRAEIAKIPDGIYTGESATDDDGTELDVPVWVRCDITVKGDEMTIDYSRSDAQRKGFVNNIFVTSYSRGIASVFLFLDTALAEYHNEGSMRPIKVIAPEGTVVNARYPCTVGASPVSVGSQLMEATTQAMSKALPHRAVAAWGRHRGHYIFGTDPRSRERYVQTTFDADGSAGAVHGYDGYPGAATFSTLGSVTRGNVEEVEIRYPWRIIKYEFTRDLMGAGRWRGGPGTEWEALNEGSEGGIATGSSDGESTQGAGLLGGGATPLSTAHIIRQKDRIRLKIHRMDQIRPGDRLHKLSGGGAGVGGPKEREPEKVLDDVLDEFISLEIAHDIYGVVINPRTMEIDWEETRALRGEK
ncbi:MAG: hydantoinase B/oxoprolinase family protein [Candidatus Methylomirabilales bacterium]